jgi:hypothetical protein
MPDPLSALHYSLSCRGCRRRSAPRASRRRGSGGSGGNVDPFVIPHVQKPERAGVCGAFPEAVHARESWEEPGIGGSAARGGAKAEPSVQAFWSGPALSAWGRSPNDSCP